MNYASRQSGFTLVEVVMAAAITSLVGMTVAGAASALSYSYNQKQNKAELLQSQRVAMNNIEKVIRTGKLVTATTGSGLIVWTGDTNGNNSMDLNELVKIEFDSAKHQVVQQSLPGLTAGLNSSLTLASANSYAATKMSMDSAIRGTYLNSTVLATNVQDFQVKTDVAAPKTTVVLIRMSTGQEAEEVTVTNSVHLRADLTSAVSFSNNIPVLTLP
jgi:type II secretory pathway pseudopilin PulG